MFRDILMKIFLGGTFSSAIILPKNGLTESYVNNAISYIEKNNGEIKLSSFVDEIIIEEEKVTGIKINEEIYNDFDFIVSSLPLHALQ